MLVVMQQGATEPQIQAVTDRLVEVRFDVHRVHRSTGVIHSVLVGGNDDFDFDILVRQKKSWVDSGSGSLPSE